jgi:hypothetical protein
VDFFCFGLFCFGPRMFAHVAACLTAALAEAAIRARVFLEKNYFSHFPYFILFTLSLGQINLITKGPTLIFQWMEHITGFGSLW